MVEKKFISDSENKISTNFYLNGDFCTSKIGLCEIVCLGFVSFLFFFSPQWHVHSLAAYIPGVSKRGLQTFDFDFFYNFVGQSSYFRGNLFPLTTIKHFFFPGPFMNRANFKYGISQSVIQIKHQIRWNNWFKKRLTFKGFLFHFVLNHNSIDKDATILKIQFLI